MEGTDGEELVPQPEGTVHLVEQATDEEGANRWTVELSWTTPPGSMPSHPEDATASSADN
ncbi:MULTISPECIES: hypothetical protein [Haloarcula]|uniref:hypothetical protein n=1 Tax=Haloarcula TaxID=2237 RepID=UPI00067761FF|nr:hypothetical protein [Haloarcula amylolytica]